MLTNSQQKAFNAMLKGENIFLTGGAGTGKTFLLKKFIEEVDPYCEHTVLAAPTGKAALNMKINCPDGIPVYGSTLHRVFGLKGEILPDFKGQVPAIIKNANRIIIDEISMLRIDLFDYVATVLMDEISDFGRAFENKPFQIILVGDFFQLPPVVRTTAEEGNSDFEILKTKYGDDFQKGYCFKSFAWDLLDIKTYELTEIVRQKDDDFCIALNKIREGDSSGIDYINENCDHSKFTTDRITLCGRNLNVTRINNYMLGQNKNPRYLFKAEIASRNGFVYQNIINNMPCEDELVLSKGVRVICIVNNESAVNGQIGTVKEVYDDSVNVIWDDGTENIIKPYIWEITRQDLKKDDRGNTYISTTIIMRIEQIPLKLAYAITIHKSQGETLKSINIKSDLFETGHLYTALSRCPDVANIRLERPLRASDVLHDKTINYFYKQINFKED